MNHERMLLKGQLADANTRIENLDIEGSGLVVLIRDYISAHEEDLTKLRLREASQSMKRLSEIQQQMIALKAKIEKLEEALGTNE